MNDGRRNVLSVISNKSPDPLMIEYEIINNIYRYYLRINIVVVAGGGFSLVLSDVADIFQR